MQKTTVYKIFISSPSDVQRERDCIPKVFPYVGYVLMKENIALEPIRWEDRIIPGLGHPQSQINQHLLEGADFCIGILKNTMGTKINGGKTGTETELDYFLTQNKDIMLYRCKKVKKNPDADAKEVASYVGKIQHKLTYYEYENLNDFKFQLYYHLLKKFYDSKPLLRKAESSLFFQFNPNDFFVTRVKNKNVASITDNGILDYTLNFTVGIIIKNLSIVGYPQKVEYEIINLKENELSQSLRIKFKGPCPNLVTITSD